MEGGRRREEDEEEGEMKLEGVCGGSLKGAEVGSRMQTLKSEMKGSYYKNQGKSCLGKDQL